MKNKAAYPDARIWRELREACLERAHKQCEFIHPNGKRCARIDGELRKSRRGYRITTANSLLTAEKEHSHDSHYPISSAE